MAISLNKVKSFSPEDPALFGKSKFWGFPDLPADVEFPYKNDNPMCFICQIDLAGLGRQFPEEGLLPKKGMLYFFADLDYFLGWSDYLENGIGLWNRDSFRLIYAQDCSELHTHHTRFDDGTPAAPDAWSIDFARCGDKDYGHRLLGQPFFEEVPSELSLLQIDEDDDWGLRFYDSGMINFIIDRKSLEARDFSKAGLYFHSL